MNNKKMNNIFEEMILGHLRSIAIAIIVLSYVLPLSLLANQLMHVKKVDRHYQLSKLDH